MNGHISQAMQRQARQQIGALGSHKGRRIQNVIMESVEDKNKGAPDASLWATLLRLWQLFLPW